MSDTNGLLPHVKLRFNIDHPSLEESYQYGYDGALSELSENDNPFKLGTIEREQWNDGWWAGFYGEEPLFAKEPTHEPVSANDHVYIESKDNLLVKFIEITGVIAVSAFVGYQLFELVG